MRKYSSPASFKVALDERLRRRDDGLKLNRIRQILVYMRFLARLDAEFGDRIILKGGLAVELRLDRARTTKDVDVRLEGVASHLILQRLKAAGQRDMDDWMTFDVKVAKKPKILADGLDYEGLRFDVACHLGGKLYGHKFGIDVAIADPMWGTPEQMEAYDDLAFIGVRPPRVWLIPLEVHIAEKLHAYTQPRRSENSRVKDLPDMALLATSGPIDAASLRAALNATFNARGTHDLPATFPDAALAWAEPYEALAKSEDLPWHTLDDVTAKVRDFLDPVLADSACQSWDPTTWTWS